MIIFRKFFFFSIFSSFFLIFDQNIDCGYTLEPLRIIIIIMVMINSISNEDNVLNIAFNLPYGSALNTEL